MTQLVTLQARLLAADGILPEILSDYGGERFREIFLKLVEKHRPYLETEGVEISLFHNHDESTGKTLIRYPLIIYHHIGNEFFITGIDAGADALRLLSNRASDLFPINPFLVVGIKLISDVSLDITLSDDRVRYSLINWLPLSQSDMNEFSKSQLSVKVAILERKLKTHLEDDFGKYMKLPLKGIRVQIEDLLHFDTHRLNYKNHSYLAFSLIFSANALLPDFITLGNGKAYGFGRVENQDRSNH